MNKIVLIFLFVFLTKIGFAEESINKNIQVLSGMLSDQHSSLVDKSVEQIVDKKRDVIIVTFSVEGFNLGNNFQQYLAVYKPEYKIKDAPPFERYGDAKIRLIGFSRLCNFPLMIYKHGTLKASKSKISGMCVSSKSALNKTKNFVVTVGNYDIEIHY